MSLLALGAMIEGRHEYEIVDGNLEDDPVEALDRAIRRGNATLLAVTVMPESVQEILSANDLALDDLDLLVMHQANLRINEVAQKSLGLPDGRVHNIIQDYGNTTSATLPVCFHHAREGSLHRSRQPCQPNVILPPSSRKRSPSLQPRFEKP